MAKKKVEKSKKANKPKRTKLNDLQKKQILASYVQTGNLSETGRKFNVSPTTVKNLVEGAEKETLKKLKEKRNENNISVTHEMNKRVTKLTGILELGLDTMETMIKEAPNDIFTSLRDVAGATKISSDILFKMKDVQLREVEVFIKQEHLEIEKKKLSIKQRELELKEMEVKHKLDQGTDVEDKEVTVFINDLPVVGNIIEAEEVEDGSED